MTEQSGIKVLCRVRPPKESDNTPVVVQVQGDDQICVGGSDDHTFRFDRVFPPECSQQEVYQYAARDIVEGVLNGYNGTVLAYGQTSSGKTHTMEGPRLDSAKLQGIIPRMVRTIFEGVVNAPDHLEFTVKTSFIEIYLERIRDLLDPTRENLNVREVKGQGVLVDGAAEVYVSSEEEVMNVMRAGANNRHIAETKMNQRSSRSHSIFIVTVAQKNLRDLSNTTGRLYLVDLAGSEKVSKTGAQGAQLEEAKQINKSLSALGNVINALTDGKSSHVPYRDSKLTRVLQESLGGNSRTSLIICVSPVEYNDAETLSTLRFGTRAKSIKNKVRVNQELSAVQLKEMLVRAQGEIENLKRYIGGLEDEVGVLKGGDGEAAGGGDGTGAGTPSLPNVHRLQATVVELEEKLAKEAEEKAELTKAHDALLDKEQERDALAGEQQENVDELLEEIAQLKARVAELEAEAEDLRSKLKEREFELEKAVFESKEKTLTIEELRGTNDQLHKDIAALQSGKALAAAAGAQGQAPAQALAASFAQENHDRQQREDFLRQSLDQSMVRHNDELAKAMTSVEASSVQLEASEQEALTLARGENATLAQAIDKVMQQVKDKAQVKLQRELAYVKTENERTLAEFDKMKEALLRDLQNRCEKVVELEMAIDEERSQRNIMLKNTSKYVQNKIANLEQANERLTASLKKLVSENSLLKLEGKVMEKKLDNRNERIKSLEEAIRAEQEKVHQQMQSHEDEITSMKEALIEARATPGPANWDESFVDRLNMSKGPTAGAAASMSMSASFTLQNPALHIAKPLRGGSSANLNQTK